MQREALVGHGRQARRGHDEHVVEVGGQHVALEREAQVVVAVGHSGEPADDRVGRLVAADVGLQAGEIVGGAGQGVARRHQRGPRVAGLVGGARRERVAAGQRLEIGALEALGGGGARRRRAAAALTSLSWVGEELGELGEPGARAAPSK